MTTFTTITLFTTAKLYNGNAFYNAKSVGIYLRIIWFICRKYNAIIVDKSNEAIL